MMRTHITPEFSTVKQAWRAAYAAYDIIANNPDPKIADHSPGAKAASDAEIEALKRLLSFPAGNAADIADKLAFMREREAETWVGYPEWMAQIERELRELQRPAVSPQMRRHFDRWRDAYVTFMGDVERPGNLERHSQAYMELMAAPCSTPGDFIVKVYLNLLGEHGSTWREDETRQCGGFIFELDDSSLSDGLGLLDGASEEAFARDIRASDLGRCLLALGQVDFDAEGWWRAAHREEVSAYVVIERDGSEGLYIGQPAGDQDKHGSECANMVIALLGAGLGEIGKDRRASVIAFIKSEQPGSVIDCRTPAGEAA